MKFTYSSRLLRLFTAALSLGAALAQPAQAAPPAAGSQDVYLGGNIAASRASGLGGSIDGALGSQGLAAAPRPAHWAPQPARASATVSTPTWPSRPARPHRLDRPAVQHRIAGGRQRNGHLEGALLRPARAGHRAPGQPVVALRARRRRAVAHLAGHGLGHRQHRQRLDDRLQHLAGTGCRRRVCHLVECGCHGEEAGALQLRRHLRHRS